MVADQNGDLLSVGTGQVLSPGKMRGRVVIDL
jgi:hypothetical protein